MKFNSHDVTKFILVTCHCYVPECGVCCFITSCTVYIFISKEIIRRMTVFYIIEHTKVKLGANSLFALDTLLYM